MATSLEIRNTSEPTSSTIHRFRNFGEDIYRSLRYLCEVDLEEIDKAIDSFQIKRIKNRDLGKVQQLIKDKLIEHNFQDCITIENV